MDALSGDADNVRAPTILYVNTKYGTLQASDPRPPPPEVDPLPQGWRHGYDPEGDVFFIDDNSEMFTYDDPRLVDVPTPSKSLRQLLRPKSLQKRRTTTRKSKVVWKFLVCR